MVKIEHLCGIEIGPNNMGKNAKKVRDTRFENKRLAALGIEPMDLSELRAKVSSERLLSPERLEFYMLMLVTSGHGAHTVDFVKWPLSTGTIIFVRPGQIQQWQPFDKYSALLILIDPAALPNSDIKAKPYEGDLLLFYEWQTCSQLSKQVLIDISESMQRLQRDFVNFDNSSMDISLMRHELLALIFRLGRWQINLADKSGASQRNSKTYRSFTRELESNFRKQHSLKYYAYKLGYAESTLSRACLAAEGHSAKSVIDRRIALEAQRMLAHSVLSIAEIGHYLGFSEPTNFVKFFKRTTQATPTEFRAQRSAVRKN